MEGLAVATLHVPVRRGGVVIGYALVDETEAWTLARRWHLSSGYPTTGRYDRLHRLLVGPLAPGLEVDHINGDKLDNRRANLRITTTAGRQNQPARVGASRFRGVYLDQRDGRWYAQVRHAGKKHHGGRFDTEEEAAEAATALRLKLLPYTNEERREAITDIRT